MGKYNVYQYIICKKIICNKNVDGYMMRLGAHSCGIMDRLYVGAIYELTSG